MSQSATDIGDKLHIVSRQQFDKDVRRHFIGEVTGITGSLHRIRGYAFVFATATNEFEKLPELRTRLVSLGETGYVVSIIPSDVVIEALDYRVVNKHYVITDGLKFTLDINEFGILN